MNILYLTITDPGDLSSRGIYPDLLRELRRRGHNLYVVTAAQRRSAQQGGVTELAPGYKMLRIKTLNLTGCNIFEKALSMMLLNRQFSRGIRHHFGKVKFDLILYATPPITLNETIESEKRRTGARTYLMLKDIFPQNAVDLGLFGESSALYKAFRVKEKKLYQISDTIGCMSDANRNYVLAHNPEVATAKVTLCPNAIEPKELDPLDENQRRRILDGYGINAGKVVSIYGGNLGKPQGVDFMMQTVEANEERTDSMMVIVGSGTEYARLRRQFDVMKPKNAILLGQLPKSEYDTLLRCADIGLIFLDQRFTIPNYPSRLLSYMEAAKPVMLATDTATDQGRIAEEAGFGLWSQSGDLDGFNRQFDRLIESAGLRQQMGVAGRKYLEQNYTVDLVAENICSS